MTAPRYHITGIGNAIVDVLARTGDDFLSRHDMRKGSMTLIDSVQAEVIYGAMPPGIEASGGSVANSCAVAAMLGAEVAFFGKTADDQLGAVFRHDMHALGIHYPTQPAVGRDATARCLILITPDGQRTMNTDLGAAVSFGIDDVDSGIIAGSAVLYLEGYLFDPPAAQAAFWSAAKIARSSGRQVAISLSDAFCVDRHRGNFQALVEQYADIVIANEAEICSLFEQNDFASAAEIAKRFTRIAVLTRGADGSVILADGKRYEIAAAPTNVVDTTGAGDAYAAGFLTAYTHGAPLQDCGALASKTAALAISSIGARPERAALAALAPTRKGKNNAPVRLHPNRTV